MVVARLVSWGVCVAALLVIDVAAQNAPVPQNTPAPQAIIAIRNVTVIPATAGVSGAGSAGGAAPIAGATVVITGDRISAIGPASSTIIPKQAKIVDGSGKFLMPGLIEMHSHASKSRASALGLFVANGVTTIREMGGDHDELLRWRREIRAGSRVGPRMFIAGPYLEAASRVERMRKDPPSERVEPFERLRMPIGSPDDARRVIGELAKKEVDFIKIRTVQDNDTYLALNEAAHANKLRLTGHVPTGMDPEFVLKAGQDDIEHGFFPPLKIASRDERLALWRKFAARGVVVVPTMVVIKKGVLAPYDHLKAVVEDAAGKIEPRRPYISLFTLKDWREQLSETTPARQKAYEEIALNTLRDFREMHEAGVELLTGSDVSVLNIFPGSTLHDELELFVTELKMTPAEAIERATRRPAKWLGIDGETGTVEQGKIADLMLLDANPLEDIRNTRRIAAVFLRGAFYDRAGIDGLLAKVRTAEDITVDDWGRK
jgi:imidazolonepropionase-like amidohydrolase